MADARETAHRWRRLHPWMWGAAAYLLLEMLGAAFGKNAAIATAAVVFLLCVGLLLGPPKEGGDA